MKPYWIRVGHKSRASCLYKKRGRTQGRWPCDRGQDWREATPISAKPSTAEDPKLGEAQVGPTDTLISDFWPPRLEENTLLLFLIHPVGGHLSLLR